MEKTNRQVTLSLRRGVTAEVRRHQDAVVARLRELAASGDFDVEIRFWGRKVVTSTGARRGSETAETIDAYRHYTMWANRAGVSLEPAFEVRRDECVFTDACENVLVPPVLCLAISEGEEPAAVFPHVNDGEVCTVEDGLDLLARTVETREPVPVTLAD